MRVRELIEKLQEMDHEAVVLVKGERVYNSSDYGGLWGEASGVKLLFRIDWMGESKVEIPEVYIE